MNLLDTITKFENEIKSVPPEQVLALAKDVFRTAKAQTFQLQQQIDGLIQELSSIYSYTEKDFDDFSTQLIGNINSPDSYFRAAVTFNLSWFISLPYSLESKIRLAQMLIDVVNGYNASEVSDLWLKIANRDYKTLQLIRFYREGSPGNVF